MNRSALLFVTVFIFSTSSIYIDDIPFALSILSAFLLVSMIYALSALGKFRYLIVLPLLSIVAANVAYRWYFGERISSGILESILNTHSHEAIGMLKAIWPISVIWIITLIFFLYCERKLYQNKNKLYAAVMPVVFCVIASLPFLTLMLKNDQFLSDVKAHPATLGTLYRHYNNLGIGDALFLGTQTLTNKLYAHNPDKTIPTSIQSHNHGVELVVLVMGESSAPTRYSAYGYPVKTTPNIERFKNNADHFDDFCLVENVHAASPITRDSIAFTLSFSGPENEHPFFEEKSIINLAHDVGYDTSWITSQVLQGTYDSKYGYLASDSKHITHVDWDDMRLTQELRRVIENPESQNKKHFIVLHMEGSHLPYHDKFDPDDLKLLPDAGNYDLSIHKTDRALAEIVNVLESSHRPYTLLFTSDHGEDVENGFGHGMVKGGSEQFLVPLMAISNFGGQEKICERIEAMRNPQGWISALTNKYLLSELLGFTVNPETVRHTIENDLITHANGKTYTWDKILEQDKLLSQHRSRLH